MTLAVVDASLVVELLIDRPRSAAARAAFEGVNAAAPELLDAEVTNAIAGLVRGRKASAEQAAEALETLQMIPVERLPHLPLVPEAWSFRHNLSTYDAFYAALARTLGCPLITCDRAFARAPGLGITVTVVGG